MEPLRIRVLTALQLERALEEARKDIVIIVFDQEERNSAPIYQRPDESSEEVSVALYGDSYKQVDSEGDWIQVEFGTDFRTGWIKKEYIKPSN